MDFQYSWFSAYKKYLSKMCQKWVIFFILQRKILHTEKVAFLKQGKKCFFLFKTFSRGPMALKTCGKDALENSWFFYINEIFIM